MDIPEEQLVPLDALAKEERVSRAEMVRRAVAMLLASMATNTSKKSSFDEAFGLWADCEEHNGLPSDGVEYQRALRAEWDHRSGD